MMKSSAEHRQEFLDFNRKGLTELETAEAYCRMLDDIVVHNPPYDAETNPHYIEMYLGWKDWHMELKLIQNSSLKSIV